MCKLEVSMKISSVILKEALHWEVDKCDLLDLLVAFYITDYSVFLKYTVKEVWGIGFGFSVPIFVGMILKSDTGRILHSTVVPLTLVLEGQKRLYLVSHVVAYNYN